MSPENFYLTTLLLMSTYSITIYNKPTTTIKSDGPPLTVDHAANRTLRQIKTDDDNKKTDSTIKTSKKKSNQCKISPNNSSKKQELARTKISQHTDQVETIQEQKNKLINKTVTVKNNITTDMLKYKHWSGIHEPSFILTVNGKKIEQGKQKKIPIKDNILEIRYDYSFAKGIRKGAKIVSCNVENDTKDVDISFSWNSEWHIKTDHAQPQKAKTVAFSG